MNRLAFFGGVLLGFGLAVGCAPVAKADTTVLATFYFHPGSGTRQLDISGTRTSDGIEVFQRAQRPEVDNPDASFLSPQSVRIFLQSGAAQQPFTLSVHGLDTHGGTVEEGSAAVTPKVNAEVPVDVFLKLYVEPADGGTDGGFTFDAGADAGSVPCGCDGGCCYPGTRTCIDFQVPFAVGPIGVFGCGPPGAACRSGADLCNTFLADHCSPTGGCACGGSDLACPAGTRCTGGQCECTLRSGCNGCCDPNGTMCLGGNDQLSCGGGGNRCDPCTNGVLCAAGRCLGQCGGNCSRGSCCSGTQCETANFPSCVGALGNCITCDVRTSSACGRDAIGTSGPDCRCGTGAACASPAPFCLRQPNGSFACQPALY